MSERDFSRKLQPGRGQVMQPGQSLVMQLAGGRSCIRASGQRRIQVPNEIRHGILVIGNTEEFTQHFRDARERSLREKFIYKRWRNENEW